MPIYWVVQDTVEATGQAMSDMDFASLASALIALGWAVIGLASASWYDSNPPMVGLGPGGITFYWLSWPKDPPPI